MTQEKQASFTKDLENKKIEVVREFDAPVQQVWKAWTDSNILNQWWAPKPWKAGTKSMDFREGGTWLYYMEGPEGERHYCRADYSSIVPGKSFEVDDAFTDENGKPNNEFPGMRWQITFDGTKDNTTLVRCNVSFKSVEDLEGILNMGFKEGFEAAHGNLDKILSR